MAQATYYISSSLIIRTGDKCRSSWTSTSLQSSSPSRLMAPAMPHSSCLWKQKSIVYSLHLFG